MTVAAPALAPASGLAATVERLALQGLRDELACYPKPGLVSFIDRGSHPDMTAETFLHSIEALKGYFSAMAEAGAASAGFAELNAIGRAAEQRMFAATNGRNTHRGAVFTLGLMAAGAGHCIAAGDCRATAICRSVPALWGAEITASGRLPEPISHGLVVRRRYGVTGAREEAAAGFPAVVEGGLPAYRHAARHGADRNARAVHALFAIIAMLPDNNLLYRGGMEGLSLAQDSAVSFLAAGGMLRRDGYDRAVAIHRAFVGANLSPGGAADLLAATIFLDSLERWGQQL